MFWRFDITHIITSRSLLSTLGLFCLLGLTYVLDQVLNLELETTTPTKLMCIALFGYLLIACSICLVINIFKPIKVWGEDSFVSYFAQGLVAGPIGGLATYLLVIFIGNYPETLFPVFVLGFIVGLIAGFMWGITFTLVSILSGLDWGFD